MRNRIEEILEGFRKEFSRKSAYRWLIVLAIGIMVRTDKLGVTSVIRDLALRPESYETRFLAASFLLTGRAAQNCQPAGAAMETSGTGRFDWRRRKASQGRPENAGSETAQRGIGNAKQGSLYLWTFLWLRGDFDRDSGKTGLFAPAFAPS